MFILTTDINDFRTIKTKINENKNISYIKNHPEIYTWIDELIEFACQKPDV